MLILLLACQTPGAPSKADDSGGNLDSRPDDSGSPADDSGTGPDDSGTAPDDSGDPPDDSGDPPDDSGDPNPDDSGDPPDDSGDPPDTGCELVMFYTDADGDGYGDRPAGSACTAPAGTVAIDGDCDDDNALAHPGLDEVCGDEVDEDCDGYVATCVSDGYYDVETDVDVVWSGDGQWFGYTVGDLGDFDGDGLVDAVIQSEYLPMSGGESGGAEPALSLIYGGSFAAGEREAWELPEKWVENVRYELDMSGDLDGDGFADMVAIGYNDRTTATVLGINWGESTRWSDGGSSSYDVEVTAGRGEFFNSGLGVGDADGDGFSDALASIGGGAALIYGDASRLADSALSDHPQLAGDSAWFGGGGTILGDLDGDGLDDAAVADIYDGMTDTDTPGAVYIAYSDGRLASDVALLDDADAVIRGPTGMGLVCAGYQLDAGDLDADGFAELAVTSHTYDGGTGIVWIFAGAEARMSGERSTDDASASVYGETASPFGVSVDMPEDIDGDGGHELFVGATNAGAYLFWGGTLSGSLTDADHAAYMGGGTTDNKIGYQVGAGDLDGDGTIDLLSGGYNHTRRAEGDGALWLLSGARL